MKKTTKFVYAAIASAILLCGCTKTKMEIPFTDFKFDSTLSEVQAIEGEEINSYPSVYLGTTHIYEKDYAGVTGSIKYMTDADDNIISVAWSYVADNDEAVNEIYNKLLSELKDTYGEPEDSDGVNNYVKIWKLEDGHVMLSSVSTSDIKALQLAYLSPAAVNFKSATEE